MYNAPNEKGNGKMEPEKKVEDQIKELYAKCEALANQVEKINSNETKMQESIEKLDKGFDQINKNFETVIQKLDGISAGVSDDMKEEFKEKKPRMKLGKKVSGVFRKIAVGTIGAVLCVKDRTQEKAANFREGVEDIIAEAHYQNKKKQIMPVEEM